MRITIENSGDDSEVYCLTREVTHTDPLWVEALEVVLQMFNGLSYLIHDTEACANAASEENQKWNIERDEG